MIRRSVLGISAALLMGGAAATEAASPRFAETGCELPALSPGIAARLRCGTVGVPRNYDDPGRGAFQLAVVVVRAPRQPALADPVVFISGGPGSPLTIHADYQARHPYAAGRDLILVDQRGVGRSEPRLCPEIAPSLLEADFAVAAAPDAAARARRVSAFIACRDEARARGIEPEWFGTAVTGEDFEQVRRALGIARWNVVGESYGTTVAMDLLARHPGTIRSAVLDSVYPPDPLPPWSERVVGARAAFFALCEQDAACAAAHPGLARLYQETVDRLGRAPPIMAVPPRLHQPGDRTALTAALFELVIGNLLYYPNHYPGLPRLIAQVHGGETASFAVALAAVVDARETLDVPAHVAVECRDRPHYRDSAAEAADSRAGGALYGICGRWSALGPLPVIPVGATVPTLVLAGQFDPNASPALSREVALRIGHRARWIEFPLVGHNVRHFSPCAAGIVAAFIGAPDQAPDAACAASPPAIAFEP